MRVLILALASALTGIALSSAAEGQTQPRARFTPVDRAEACPANRAPIMILGTYHMANPALDAVNIEADDVLSPRRRSEIEELTDHLARFGPTKVMLEAPYAESATQQRYERYLAGTYQLTRNEIDQVGFRLARKAGLTRVNPIDFPMMMSGLTYDELERRPRNPQPITQSAQSEPSRPLSADELRLRQSTVSEYLLYLNEPAKRLEDHLGYMGSFEPEAENPAIYQAADYLTNWYKRNFRMWANVVRKTERPQDRVFLLVGSGHLAILRSLAQDMPGFCLVEPQSYLQP